MVQTIHEWLRCRYYGSKLVLRTNLLSFHSLCETLRISPLSRALFPELVIEQRFSIKRLEVDFEAIIYDILDARGIILYATSAHKRSLLLGVSVACSQVEVALCRGLLIRGAWPEDSLLNLRLLVSVLKRAGHLWVGRSAERYMRMWCNRQLETYFLGALTAENSCLASSLERFRSLNWCLNGVLFHCSAP